MRGQRSGRGQVISGWSGMVGKIGVEFFLLLGLGYEKFPDFTTVSQPSNIYFYGKYLIHYYSIDLNVTYAHYYQFVGCRPAP